LLAFTFGHPAKKLVVNVEPAIAVS